MKRTRIGNDNDELRENRLMADVQLSAQPQRSLRLCGALSRLINRDGAPLYASTKISRKGAKTQRMKIRPVQLYLGTFASLRLCGKFSTLILLIVLAGGCRQDMQDQPKMKPYRGTTFFSDGLSARQPVEGTIPRGYLRTDTEFFTGKKRGTTTSPRMPGTPAGPQPSAANPTGANAYPDDVEVFPFPVTTETVSRGRERYDIFCSACHGLTGYGDGIIVRRGFRRAASFHDDRLRQAPVGHFFDAITNGWGAMPSYSSQIPVQDRWAIIAYVRALQLSQQPQPARATPAPAASPTPATGGHP